MDMSRFAWDLFDAVEGLQSNAEEVDGSDDEQRHDALRLRIRRWHPPEASTRGADVPQHSKTVCCAQVNEEQREERIRVVVDQQDHAARDGRVHDERDYHRRGRGGPLHAALRRLRRR